MDIKLKSKSDKDSRNIKLNIICVVIMFIVTSIIMNLYPVIKENGSKQKDDKYFSHEIGNIINNSDFFFLKDITDYENGKNNSLEDVYIKSYELNDDMESEDSDDYEKPKEYSESDKEKAKKDIQNALKERYDDANTDIKYNYKNIQYAVLDKDNNIIKTNSDDSINNLNNIKDNYDFYVKMIFDKNGYISLKNTYGMKEQMLYSEIRSNRNSYSDSSGILKAEANNITNCSIIYAIPKTLKYTDELSNMKTAFESSVATKTVAAFVVSVCIIFLILFLFVPYKTGIKIMYSRAVKKVPLEIAAVMYGILAYIILVLGTYGIQMTLDGSLLEALNNLNMGKTYSNIVLNTLNIGLWITAMYSIFTGVMLLKFILKKGLVNYIKENTVLFSIFRFVKRKYYSIEDYVSHIDLRDKTNAKVAQIILINLGILCAISVILFLGLGIGVIAGILIYSIVLYILLTKYINDIKNKFSRLMYYAEEISRGNLDIEINDDLGVFNPVKNVVINIKAGFKNAVNEEVKSQRMKTELISNVSHDLKTPLTSIITYVDLLKKPEITEAERNEYIETLDRKSQRLKVLIEDLFEVSKATSGNIKLNLSDVDIVQLVKQTIVELEDKLNNSGLQLKCSYPQEKVILSLDGAKTYRIFENLLNNISKYAMENTRVYIEVKNYDDKAEVIMKNISADEINFTSDEITERFKRGDKSRNTEGSGLGLAIAKSFAEAQNGKLVIDIDGDLFKAAVILNKH